MSAENALRLQVEYLTMAVDDEREKAACLERERDALAAQLAALREAWEDVLRREIKSHWGGGGYEQRSLWHLRDTFAGLSTTTAEAYTRRVQAEARSAALEEARAAIEMAFGSDEDVSAQEVIDRLLDADRAAKIRGGR